MLDKYKCNHWQIAYRCSANEEFQLISNPKWGWCADPFLVKYRGEIYLFAEIFLYKSERNGVIGYCRFDGKEFGKWKVSMDKHWHMSYPNVFVFDDRLFMCPETHQLDEVNVYELKEFPDKWKKVTTLISNEKCVDTTFFRYNEEQYMFTFKPTFSHYGGGLFLYKIENNKAKNAILITDDRSLARPGGNVLFDGEKYIRIGQNCQREYGGSLTFCEIESVWPQYKEKPIKELSVNDLGEKFKERFCGIHTYNVLDGIEVVDLKYKKFSFSEQVARRRVKRIFLNKY